MVFLLLLLGIFTTLLRSGAFAAPDEPAGAAVPPIAPSSWLAKDLGNPDLLVLDVRDPTSYNASHVQGSSSIPFDFTSVWARTSVNETLSMPPEDELSRDLGAYGLAASGKWVVIVTDMASMPIHITYATRVAATLRYAGFKPTSMGILDGGIAAWMAAGEDTSRKPGVLIPTTYTGIADDSFIVDRKYVHDRIGLTGIGIILLDIRTKSTYNSGHIESYATAWFYVLTSVLGYENIKLYDGSTTDWVKEYGLVSS